MIFPKVLEGAIQLMARALYAAGSIKRRNEAKKTRFSARMARIDIGRFIF
jgi:hypothetical protein